MPHMLKDALASRLAPPDLNLIFSAFDMVGDIVILKIPEHLMQKKDIIGILLVTQFLVTLKQQNQSSFKPQQLKAILDCEVSNFSLEKTRLRLNTKNTDADSK